MKKIIETVCLLIPTKRYHMKTIVMFFVLFCFAQISFAQRNSIPRLIKYVERNISAENKGADKKSTIDFFIYDITLSSAGTVSEIHTMVMDTLHDPRQVKRLADSIKTTFQFNQRNLRKLYVPVMIVYSHDDDILLSDSSLVQTTNLFPERSKNIRRHVVMTKIISIVSLR